jgi:hypothetical protein
MASFAPVDGLDDFEQDEVDKVSVPSHPFWCLGMGIRANRELFRLLVA